MSRTVGIDPRFLAKLSGRQRAFILTSTGLRFYDEYLCRHGRHTFVFGTTGSGKTQKGYWLVDWHKHLETQIWISTGKTNEILPLLFMGRKVRIITPERTDVIIEERNEGTWQRVTEGVEVVYVSTPEQALDAIATGSWDENRHRVRDTITILEIRNAFLHTSNAVAWIAEFFDRLAKRCRLGEMPDIFPATVHIDEIQWASPGKRVSEDSNRNKAAEIITENSLEGRSIGIRLCLYAQSFRNVRPAARENMLYNIICRGGNVKPDENESLARWCRPVPWRNPRSPLQYQPWQGRFVFEDGDSYPKLTPWEFPLFPERQEDRERLARMRVRYVGKHDAEQEQDEIETECLPELGRFSALAIPPEKQVLGPHYDRYTGMEALKEGEDA